MQPTGNIYKNIMAGEHWFETKVTITNSAGNDFEFGEDTLLSVNVYKTDLPKRAPSIGGTVSAQLVLEMIEPSITIPKRGKIVVAVRAKSKTQTSDWQARGTYYIDTREVSRESGSIHKLKITAYDAMMKAEKAFPSTSHDWPARDTTVVNDIVEDLGITLDSRVGSIMTASNWIELPSEYTEREILGFIAAYYCANWVVTAQDKLMLVPLYGIDLDNVIGNYLADQNGNALTAGNEEWCLLV